MLIYDFRRLCVKTTTAVVNIIHWGGGGRGEEKEAQKGIKLEKHTNPALPPLSYPTANN